MSIHVILTQHTNDSKNESTVLIISALNALPAAARIPVYCTIFCAHFQQQTTLQLCWKTVLKLCHKLPRIISNTVLINQNFLNGAIVYRVTHKLHHFRRCMRANSISKSEHTKTLFRHHFSKSTDCVCQILNTGPCLTNLQHSSQIRRNCFLRHTVLVPVIQQVAELWHRDHATHALFSIKVQLYLQNHKIAVLSHLIGESEEI